MLVTVRDPIAGDVRIVGNPVKMNGVDDRHAPAPHDLAQDTRSVLRTLAGLDDGAIDALAASGAIGLHRDEAVSA
jgi:crotonobetainyl-CoA:carnitine CoA-transferase CaiB-like acyl-CoA transferase